MNENITIEESQSKIIVLNKPKGYVVTRSDNMNRKTVYDLLPDWLFDNGWMPIGRLDKDTKGLLLFTRDGKISEYLTRPGTCRKLYEVWVRGQVTDEHIKQLLKGVESPVGLLKAKNIEKKGGAGPKTRLIVELDQGKNRHIRRLFSELQDPLHGTSLKVVDLKRVQIGEFKLDIDSGKWRYLTELEESTLT